MRHQFVIGADDYLTKLFSPRTLLAHVRALLRRAESERLTNHVWGDRGIGDRQLLKQLVYRLRQKIERNPTDPQYIVTAAGIGYMLQPSDES